MDDEGAKKGKLFREFGPDPVVVEAKRREAQDRDVAEFNGRAKAQFVALLRWLAVLPASLFVAIIAVMLTNLVTGMILLVLHVPPNIVQFLLDVIGTTTGLNFFMVTGLVVAPRPSNWLAAVLLIFYSIYQICALTLVGRTYWLTMAILAFVVLYKGLGIVNARLNGEAEGRR